MKQQKKKYEENHKKNLDDQSERYKSKFQEMIDKKDGEIKKTQEEKEHLTIKCENYKKQLAGFAKKQEELEELELEEPRLKHFAENNK